MQNFKRKGETINNWRNDTGADVKGGRLVVVGDVVGVAASDITNGAPGVLAMEGVFELLKDNALIKQGQRVYVGAGGLVTATAGADPAGVAWADAAAASATVLVKINI